MSTAVVFKRLPSLISPVNVRTGRQDDKSTEEDLGDLGCDNEGHSVNPLVVHALRLQQGLQPELQSQHNHEHHPGAVDPNVLPHSSTISISACGKRPHTHSVQRQPPAVYSGKWYSSVDGYHLCSFILCQRCQRQSPPPVFGVLGRWRPLPKGLASLVLDSLCRQDALTVDGALALLLAVSASGRGERNDSVD